MLNAETYITGDKGIGGDIRVKYEDFYVEEIPEHLPSGTGPNTWLFIEKIGRNTLDVVLDIAKEMKISRKRMGFAGMKDKSALTRQWLCVANSEASELQGLEEKLYNVKVLEIKQNEKKLRIGQLIGNKFRILIRNTNDPENDAETAKKVLTKLEEVWSSQLLWMAEIWEKPTKYSQSWRIPGTQQYKGCCRFLHRKPLPQRKRPYKGCKAVL